jgi:hypothetical protein
MTAFGSNAVCARRCRRYCRCVRCPGVLKLRQRSLTGESVEMACRWLVQARKAGADDVNGDRISGTGRRKVGRGGGPGVLGGACRPALGRVGV